MAIYKTDQEAAIAAWTLIMSMDDLMLEVEETAIFLEQIYSKNWESKDQANPKSLDWRSVFRLRTSKPVDENIVKFSVASDEDPALNQESIVLITKTHSKTKIQ